MKQASDKMSLKKQLIIAFLVTSIIPIILVNLIFYHNISGIVKENVQEMIQSNLLKTKENMDIWIDSYEDILWQIYTDDELVNLVDKINSGKDLAVNKKKLRLALHGLFYTKEYIKSISVITENGTLVFYDLITGSGTKSSWNDVDGLSMDSLYETISMDNDIHVFSTKEAVTRGGEKNFLFHIGHRIIDYKNVGKQLGVVVVSIDEKLLKSVCSMDDPQKNTTNFIVDKQGNMVSCIDESLLTTPVIQWDEDIKNRQISYEEFVKKQFPDDFTHLMVNVIHDERFQWDIVNVSSQHETIKKLSVQQNSMLSVFLVFVIILAGIIIFLIKRFTGPLQNMTNIMQKTGMGDLSARVLVDKTMPKEVEFIAVAYNNMMDRLVDSIQKEKEAGEKQRSAEIAALEAQINPHFLYNTLDTINWMAIDRDEYEISNSISALAMILRYGIDNSNGIVTIREESEWLKKYLFLQQTRLKNTFQCEIHIEPELMEKRIHKLLLQPFVENSILHGFEGTNRMHFLSVDITMLDSDWMQIIIYDNGKGIEEKLLEQINRGYLPKSSEKNHIGMENAINRIHMYYGDDAIVEITSKVDSYTKIRIQIPEA